jgi:uncharacterized membrane protein
MGDSRIRFVMMALPALIAVALRLYDLAGQPLWLDEVITHNRALLPLPALVSDSLINKHFPTYFMLARAFDAPLIDAWMLRLPSVIFGSLAVLLVTLIAAEVRSPRAGLAAGLLIAFSPIDVQFSQEARPYTFAAVLILLALYGLVRIVRHVPDGAGAPAARKFPAQRTGAAWAVTIAGTLAALYTLVVAAIWWLASNAAIAVVAARAGAARGPFLRTWLSTQGLIALIWLPALAVLYSAGDGDPLRGYRWIPPSTWAHVSAVLSSVYLYRASNIITFALLPTPVPWLGLIVLALALFGAWRLRAMPQYLTVIGCALLAMPLAMLIASTVHAVWIPRYLLWSTGPLYVLAGVGMAALPWRSYGPVLAALLVAGAFNLAPYYGAETKPRWDLAAGYLATHARDGDRIVASGYPAKYVLDAYAARAHLTLPIIDGGNVARTTAALPAGGRTWLLYGRIGQSAVAPEADYLRRWAMLGPPAETIRFGRSVVAWRFGPPAH